MRHCKPGEFHTPPNEERARQLIEQGFITPVEDPEQKAEYSGNNEGTKDATRLKGGRGVGRGAGKKSAGEVKDGDGDGGEADESSKV